jgi:hypothetical protein
MKVKVGVVYKCRVTNWFELHTNCVQGMDYIYRLILQNVLLFFDG